jgi:hypothetical protein
VQCHITYPIPVHLNVLPGFVPPYGLKEILSALAEESPEATAKAYHWAMIIFVVHLTFAQVDLFQAWHSRRCYERTRGQLFCTLNYKALKRQDISGKASRDKEQTENADLGKIVNLMQSVSDPIV